MSDAQEPGAQRVKPTERGWTDAKREVEDRNAVARKAGKERQAEHQKRLALMKKNSKAER
jgi:hypothetical protein